MKTIKYLMMGALMIGFSTQANAQDGTAADVAAVKQMISSKPADFDKQMKNYYKKNKKNVVNLLAFAKAFYAAKDTANARTFANYTLAASKNKNAEAFIMLGDIQALGDNGGEAASYYTQARYADPKNPEAYFKYANVYRKISPSEAISVLEELRAQRPDVAVDAIAGRIYYLANDFEKALEYYNKADMTKMEDSDLSDYAMSAFFKQQNQKSLEIAQYGLTRKPRSAAFNRLAFFNSTDLKEYDQALKYADALFNQSDSAKFSYFDYTYYGNAYNGAKQSDKAIEMYEKALAQPDMDNKDKRAGIIEQITEAYLNKDDFDNAIKYHKEYIATVEKPTANDLAKLGQLHTQKAGTLEGDAQKEELKNADVAYEDLQNRYENAIEYATFMRARVNSYQDPDQKLGLALPFYQKLEEMIAPKETKDKADNARLIEAYRYMISYYYVAKDDKAKATEFAHKLLKIDPENDIAKQVLGVK